MRSERNGLLCGKFFFLTFGARRASSLGCCAAAAAAAADGEGKSRSDKRLFSGCCGCIWTRRVGAEYSQHLSFLFLFPGLLVELKARLWSMYSFCAWKRACKAEIDAAFLLRLVVSQETLSKVGKLVSRWSYTVWSASAPPTIFVQGGLVMVSGV